VTAIWVILAILMIGIMILVHELGHFVVGRLCGIGVEEFSIGFGPKIFGWRKKEIDYSLRAIPLGGYVRFTGEDEDSADANAFNNHPVWKRFLTVVAGASMNFVLAFVAILLLFSLYGVIQVPEFSAVEPGSPAEMAGLMAGDRVVAVDGIEISYDQQGFNEMYELFSARTDGTPFQLTIERGGEEFDVSVSKAQTEEGAWQMGVLLGVTRRVSFPLAFEASCQAFVGMSGMLLDFLKNLVFRGEGVEQVSGTVGSQASIRSVSSDSLRAFPGMSSAQSLTTTRRLSHMSGSVSADSMTSVAETAPSNTLSLSCSKPSGRSLARRV